MDRSRSWGVDVNPVCLIIPPSPFLLDERVFMSLGLLRIAAVLEKTGIPVEVMDLSGIENFTEALKFHISKNQNVPRQQVIKYVNEKKTNELPMWAIGQNKWPSILPEVSREIYSELAEIASIKSGTEAADELPKLYACLCEAGETSKEALRTLREFFESGASSRLQQTIGNKMVMPSLSFKTSQGTTINSRISEAKVFGITSTTPQMPSAALLAKIIRRERPDARIILGGPHPTLVLAAYKKEQIYKRLGRANRAKIELENIFDVIVAGDGEQAIFKALEPDAAKWIDGDDPKGLLFLTNEKLNELPFPARHLVDVESYHYSIDGIPATSLIAQLGCPFGCGFCGGRNSPMLRRVRMRTTKNVIEEVSHLYQTYGVKGFMFYDDELNVNPQMVEMMNAIAKTQRDFGVEFRLRGFVKSQLFTDEQAKAMYEAGFRWLLTGFESGSERILTNINKRATQAENTRCADIARRHGLKVKALMSIGHPGESLETLDETKKWLLDTKPSDFDVTIITPYPGSPYYDEAVQSPNGDWTYTYKATGDRLHAEEVDYFKTADYYKGDPNGGYRSYVYTDHLSKEDLVRERDKLESSVRKELNIPFNPSAVAVRFEHSMGQTSLPERILKTSKKGVPMC